MCNNTMFGKIVRNMIKYELSMRKFYGLNDSLKYLPIIYLGNKHVNDYVKDARMIVYRQNNKYYAANNLYSMHTMKHNYHKIMDDPTITKEHKKIVTVAHRISVFLTKNDNQ